MRTTTNAISIPALAISAMLAASWSVAAVAGSSSAEMRVSVTVVARTLVDVDRAAEAVTVTDADIRRGWIEVPAALALRVKSNAREGYLLRFQPLQGPFTRGELSWGNNLVQLGADERWITQRTDEQGAAVMNLRLQLADGVKPGVYPLNLGVTGDSI